MIKYWIKNSEKKDKNGKPFQILTICEYDETEGGVEINKVYTKAFVSVSKEKGTVYLNPIQEK